MGEHKVWLQFDDPHKWYAVDKHGRIVCLTQTGAGWYVEHGDGVRVGGFKTAREAVAKVARWIRGQAHDLTVRTQSHESAVRRRSHVGTAVAACLEVIAECAENGSMLRDFRGLAGHGEGVGDG